MEGVIEEDKGLWIGEGGVRDEKVREVREEDTVRKGGRVEMLGLNLTPGSGHLSRQR